MVESIQSIYNSMCSWHNNATSAVDIVVIMLSSMSSYFQALHCVVFSNFCNFREKLKKAKHFKKLVIQQFLNSVSTASKLVSVLTATDLGIDNSWYNAKSHSIIAYNNIFVTLYLPWLHCLSYKIGGLAHFDNKLYAFITYNSFTK